MLVGKQVALFGHWLAEAKCHANSTVPHFLKGRPKEALDNPGVAPRLTSKSLAASRMLRVLVEVFQSFPNPIYYFTVSCEVFRTSIISRLFREADCLSQLKKVPTSLIITQHIDKHLFFDIAFKNSTLSVHCLPTFRPTWITVPKVNTSAKPIVSC
jgi:hypothetical protein